MPLTSTPSLLFVDAATHNLHLLLGSAAIDSGTAAGAPLFDRDNNPRPMDGDGDGTAAFDMGAYELQPPTAPCDFDGLNGCDIVDIDALVMGIVAGSNNLFFDLTDDDVVDLADRDRWLQEAGAIKLMSGNPYLQGDSNEDGVVDGQDFIDLERKQVNVHWQVVAGGLQCRRNHRWSRFHHLE